MEEDRHDTPILPAPMFEPQVPPPNCKCYRCPYYNASVYKGGTPLCLACAAIVYTPIGR